MYFSKVVFACFLAAAVAKPQANEYSDIDDENDPRYGFDPNPSYSFKYQVSDDTAQTYMAHDETRDSNAVTGQYSYVDPNGSLITVKYIADENGYQETREVKENFVDFVPYENKPKTTTTTPRPTQPPRPAPTRRPDSDLVAQIIAQLTPFIKQTVSDSLTN